MGSTAITIKTLRCEGCGKEKAVVLFYKTRSKCRYGRDNLCKPCREAKRRMFRGTNGRCNSKIW